jgi:hypothetical protein
LFAEGNMIDYSDISNGESDSAGNRKINSTDSRLNKSASRIYHHNTLHAEHYTTMDLCSQAQMFESTDDILIRMNKLRIFAKEQQIRNAKPQRQQTSFCF